MRLEKRGARTRMLHVPFSLLKASEVSMKTAVMIRRRYGASAALAEALVGKRFRSPADFVRDDDIQKLATPIELFRLSVPPVYDHVPERSLPGAAFSSIEIEGIRTAVGAWKWSDGRLQLGLSATDGDIFSIQTNDQGQFDLLTTRLGGFIWWEWPKLSFDTRRRLKERLMSPQIQNDLRALGNMDLQRQPVQDGSRLPIRGFAQLALFLKSAMSRDTSVSGTGSSSSITITIPENPDEIGRPPADDPPLEEVCSGRSYNPDGMNALPGHDACSYSPDWPFSRCCSAHDFCYLCNPLGCNECSRLECDLDFLQCMMRTAGANPALQEMAWVYFVAVRAFGNLGDGFFRYCGAARGDGGMDVNKLVLLGLIAVSTAVGVTSGAGFAEGAALSALVLAIGALTIGIVTCETCAFLDNLVEICEADSHRRTEECARLQERCRRRRNPFRRLLCHLRFFWSCRIVDIILRGACTVVRTVRAASC
jgi:hypothetical protein